MDLEKKIIESLIENTTGKVVDKTFEYLDSVIKPSIEGVGDLLGDQIRYWRYRNQIRIAQKVNRIHLKRGIVHPNISSIKNITYLLDASSYEENEMISDMWSNLLANITDPSRDNYYATSFIKILSELSTNEVLMLEEIYKNGIRKSTAITLKSIVEFLRTGTLNLHVQNDNTLRDEEVGYELRERALFMVRNYIRLGLFEHYLKQDIGQAGAFLIQEYCLKFLETCHDEFDY